MNTILVATLHMHSNNHSPIGMVSIVSYFISVHTTIRQCIVQEKKMKDLLCGETHASDRKDDRYYRKVVCPCYTMSDQPHCTTWVA